MARRLSAKVGEYPDKQTGDTKGEYVQIGVILNNANGDYILLDPTVSLAGILAKQNALEFKKGGVMRDNVMVGIYEEQNNQQGGQQQGGYQQQQPQNKQQHNDPQHQQQGGYGNNRQ